MITLGQSVDIYAPSMPPMTTALHTTNALIQLSITVALLAFAVSVLLFGVISDHYGRRAAILSGVAIFITGSVICLLSQDIATLLLGRAIQGFGLGSVGAVAPALPRDVYEGPELIKAYSYVGAATAVVPILAPLLGGYLQQFFGWRASFIFLLIYAVIIFCLLYFKLPETNLHRKKGLMDVKEIVSNYLGVIRNKLFWGFAICFVFSFAGEIAYFVALPFISQQQLGFTPAQTGWLTVFTASSIAVGAAISARLSKRGLKTLVLGLAISFLGAISMVLLYLAGQRTISSIVAPMILYMVGAGITYPNAISGAMSATPKQSGKAAALMSGLSMLIAGIATWLIALFPEQSQGPLAWLLGGVSLAAYLIYRLLIHPTNSIKS